MQSFGTITPVTVKSPNLALVNEAEIIAINNRIGGILKLSYFSLPISHESF